MNVPHGSILNYVFSQFIVWDTWISFVEDLWNNPHLWRLSKHSWIGLIITWSNFQVGPALSRDLIQYPPWAKTRTSWTSEQLDFSKLEKHKECILELIIYYCLILLLLSHLRCVTVSKKVWPITECTSTPLPWAIWKVFISQKMKSVPELYRLW